MNKPALRPLAAAIALALPLALPATADAQSWMARVRAIDIAPNVSSSINGLDVDNAWVPELDFTYFFSKNLAAELILATARHEVTLNGTSVGKVSILPPTITVQYHFTDLGAWKPYVGGGINFTYFYNVGLTNPLGLSDDWSVGGALQAGLYYEIQKNVYLNLDVKYVWVSNDVTAGSATIGDLKINPWVFGLGVGWRF
ncbi:MAG TPA: OmpW family outer membrane protein [Casimicrobiaceae bacterium]|nr:OmpW family outer membrane protein [Casimicrobiaceae bacterium]